MQFSPHRRGHTLLSLLTLAAAMVSLTLTAPAGAQRPAPSHLQVSATSLHLNNGDRVPASGPSYLPGQIVVKYEPAGTANHLLAATARGQVRILAQLPQLEAWLIKVAAGTEEAVMAQLQCDPLVQYVELNHRVHALEVPNDANWPEQWALPRIGAPQAWDIAHCQGTIVAVLDTGVALDHPDLGKGLWTNPGEVPYNGIDDDGNGKVDDVHGWHFYQNCSTATCEPFENHIIQDDNGHGTHVTGIIAADTDNGTGIAGVSWGAQAMVVKTLDRYGDGYYSDIAAGIIYATDNGARVINLSLGGDESSQLLQDAVNYAYQRGVLLIAAAGNSGGSVLFPAACENVVAVAAADRDDQRLGFSNYGPEVDIAAPGDSIISTWPWLDGYYYKQGTSMAAAHVSGAAALLWSWRPDFANAEIEHRLETQAEDVNAAIYPGHDPYLGWGRLDMYRALAGLPAGPTLTPTPSPTMTRTPTATATKTITPTNSPTPTRYIYYLLPVFKNARDPR